MKKATYMATPGGELCTTISVCMSGTIEPGAGTTPPEVSKSTSGACKGGGTCRQKCPLLWECKSHYTGDDVDPRQTGQQITGNSQVTNIRTGVAIFKIDKCMGK